MSSYQVNKPVSRIDTIPQGGQFLGFLVGLALFILTVILLGYLIRGEEIPQNLIIVWVALEVNLILIVNSETTRKIGLQFYLYLIPVSILGLLVGVALSYPGLSGLSVLGGVAGFAGTFFFLGVNAG